MADPVLAVLKNNAPLGVPWAEILDDPGTSDANWSTEASRLTMTIQTNSGKDTWLMISNALGYSTSSGDGTSLSRQLPMPHPRFPNFYCVQIGKQQDFGYVSKDASGVGGYTRTNSQLTFQSLNYDVLPDAGLGKGDFANAPELSRLCRKAIC